MKPPAFQFYADDFLAGTANLSDAEAGLYVRLLCAQWSAGGLPDDDAELASYGKGGTPVNRVRLKFAKGADGLLRNTRLEKVREHQNEWREKCSRGGRAASSTRKGSSTTLKLPLVVNPQVNPQVNANTPVSSLQSPVSIDKDNTNDSMPDGSGPAAAETVAPVAKRNATAPQTDTDWLNGLKSNAAYQGIDVAREHAKAQVWCENKRRVLTRARFINWLNRAERPMAGRATMR